VARVAASRNDRASAFLQFLTSPKARDIFEEQGFRLLE
jgi:ABC-type molybdate transport system substrate-binding protein